MGGEQATEEQAQRQAPIPVARARDVAYGLG